MFCFVLFYFILFCFVLFCFVLFCFILFCFILFCFVLFCFVFCFVFCIGLFYLVFVNPKDSQGKFSIIISSLTKYFPNECQRIPEEFQSTPFLFSLCSFRYIQFFERIFRESSRIEGLHGTHLLTLFSFRGWLYKNRLNDTVASVMSTIKRMLLLHIGYLKKHFTVGDCQICGYSFNSIPQLLFLLSASCRRARNQTIKDNEEGVRFL